jgi:hypothetical protein
MPRSLMNIATEPFLGAANSLYGPRGPQGPANTGRGRRPLSGPPQSLEEHVRDAIARVPDLSPRQRNALRNVMMTLTRDLSFIRLINEAAHHGPWSEAVARGDKPQG